MRETSPKQLKRLKSPKGKRAGPDLDKLMRGVQHMLLDPIYLSLPSSEWKRAWEERGQELGKRIQDCFFESLDDLPGAPPWQIEKTLRFLNSCLYSGPDFSEDDAIAYLLDNEALERETQKYIAHTWGRRWVGTLVFPKRREFADAVRRVKALLRDKTALRDQALSSAGEAEEKIAKMLELPSGGALHQRLKPSRLERCGKHRK